MAENSSKRREGASGHGHGGGGGGGDGDGEILCGIDFYFLPEGCIAAVLCFTSPRDACRLASVSKIFKSAADSDCVWVHFLPSDYRDILESSDGGGALLSSLSKKQLFFHLAQHPLLLNGGSKSFSLERSSGKKCYTIAARELQIVWGDTPKYWTWRSSPESRFAEVAELVTVCWLEIRGKLKTQLLSPDTNYAAYLVFKMTEEAYGFYSPANVVVKNTGGKTETQTVYLDVHEGQNQRYQRVPRRIGVLNWSRYMRGMMQPATKSEGDVKLPKQREDGWLEVEIGEFWIQRGEDEEVEMSVELKTVNWKGGLVVEGIEIRPKAVGVP